MDNYNYTSIENKPLAVVVDDHQLFADSFSRLLESIQFFKKVFSFADTKELPLLLSDKTIKGPIYLFLDYYLKGDTIYPVISELKRYRTNLNIIIVTSLNSNYILQGILKLSVHGILHKSSSIEDVKTCIDYVSKGRVYYSDIIQEMMQEIKESSLSNVLTPREVEILEFFAKGLTVDETGDKLHLSRHTIAAHRRKMFMKTNSNNITDLLNYARDKGIIAS